MSDMWSGSHVRLRQARAGDVDDLLRLQQSAEVVGIATERVPYPARRRDVEDLLAADHEDALPFVIARTSDDQPVGTIGLKQIHARDRRAWIGMSILPEHQGRGYGTEALELLVTYAFEQVNLVRLALRALATNTRAIEVYRRAGFEEEGRARDEVWRDGRYVDVVVMARLAPGLQLDLDGESEGRVVAEG